MATYKIERRTIIELRYQKIKDTSKFVVYLRHKFLWFHYWERLAETVNLGGTIYHPETSFDRLEDAEEFVKLYHDQKERIGKLEIVTVEILNMGDD